MYDIFFNLNNMHRTVRQKDEELEEINWTTGIDFDFTLDLPQPTDDYPVIVKRYGCHCDKCGEYYPYAEVVTPFKCWSCRNF